MPFNKQSRLDPSQVEDRRGRKVGKGAAIGGGGIGIVVLLIAVLLGANPADLAGLVEQPSASVDYGATESEGTLLSECQTGADASVRDDCRVVGFVNSIQAFWTDEFARQGSTYAPAKTQLFSDATQGACGYANAAVGPFYCPADQKVYLDLTFFNDLQARFGARGGPFAEAYVLAHEYGHHVQNLAGILDSNSRGSGPQSMAVQIELQADCLAGVWAHNAEATGFLMPVTEAEIAQSMDAAAAVGDDRIQQQMQGRVSPESWTHGSSEQRQRALLAGFRSGDVAACDISR